jgi:transposase-like protein
MNTLKKFNQKFKKEIKMVLTTQGAKYSEELKNKVKGFVLAHHESDGKKGFSPATISEITGINKDLIYRWRYQALNPDGSGYGQKKKTKELSLNQKLLKASEQFHDSLIVKKKTKKAKFTKAQLDKMAKEVNESLNKGTADTTNIHSLTRRLIAKKIVSSDIIDQLHDISADDHPEEILAITSFASVLFEKILEYCEGKIDDNHFKS